MHWLRISSVIAKSNKNKSFLGSLGKREDKALYQEQLHFLTLELQIQILHCQVPQGTYFGKWGCPTSQEESGNEDSFCWAPGERVF